MPNTNWSNLNSLQLGRYAEYYAKMEIASYGLEVYTSEVDDHGVDFICKKNKNEFLQIQVKSIRDSGYVFMQARKWDIEDINLFLILLIFIDGKLPDIFLIPATEWQKENALFKYKTYEGLKSEPEYGLNLSKKNLHLLDKFRLDASSLNIEKPIKVIK